MNLGENIYRLRTAKNMSQGDLADALNVSRQSVSKWETGSATPELEKLIRMSELFGVTLDALAGIEQASQQMPPQPSAPEPKIIYVEKPVQAAVSKRALLGTALLLGSLLYALLLNSSVFDPLWAIILALPVAICGVLCLFAKYPQLWCGWVGAAAYWLYLLTLHHHNWEEQYVLMLLGIGLVLAVIIWSVRAHRKGLVHIPGWMWLLGFVVLGCSFILLWINVVPPIGVSVTEHSVESAVSGAQ